MAAQFSRFDASVDIGSSAAGSQRADARRNRDRLLEATREVFADQGINAPMTSVARRAGVGVATLYRHFPTRDDLARAAFTGQMSACTAALTRAAADPDPWRAFTDLIETVCRLQREERGFPAAFIASFSPDDVDAAYEREPSDLQEDLKALVRRAQAAGVLRPDFHPADLGIVWLANEGLVTALPDDPAASRRLVAYLLESFRTVPARGALPPPGVVELADLADRPRGTRP
ncbi:TetR/AcrR family transcriptional regulator [Streptomyces sp. NPDC102451]|uniref:TetR/AcrR family transcriptional regulator n=1 Tax=Streptomyces sp. NPDC102451 TaxID=3366177 RepID=UPI003822E975